MQTSSRRIAARWLALCACAFAAFAGAAPASAHGAPPVPAWAACGDAEGVQCATIKAPLDYDNRNGETLDVHVARVPASDTAHRIGSLFINFGGPGAATADIFEAFGRDLFPALSARYDIIAVDARGTGQTEGAIDCQVNQETTGIYSKPFTTPFNLDVNALLTKARTYVKACLTNNDPHLLRHFSTANTARDFDFVRRALREDKLNYLGFSYGTVLGATYATLFPHNYNRFVLDGPVDVTQYYRNPAQNLREQTAGFERALGRFFQACAADQVACSGFGGKDPWKAFDRLIDQANATPIPAPNSDDPRPIDGDDIIAATNTEVYAQQAWSELAYALNLAEEGDGSGIRDLADSFWGREDDNTFDPLSDGYFVLGAIEQPFSRSIATALRQGDESWGEFDHYYFNFGYVHVNYALWPIRDRDAYRGPFRIPASANTALVTATTYDPATPFNGARRYARDLGNVRFLKVRADGHTVYGSTGACADAVIEGYLLEGTLPAAGTVCEGDQPFEAFTPEAVATAARVAKQLVATSSQGRLQRPGR